MENEFKKLDITVPLYISNKLEEGIQIGEVFIDGEVPKILLSEYVMATLNPKKEFVSIWRGDGISPSITLTFKKFQMVSRLIQEGKYEKV